MPQSKLDEINNDPAKVKLVANSANFDTSDQDQVRYPGDSRFTEWEQDTLLT